MPILYPPVVVSLNTAIPIPVLNCPVVLLKILHPTAVLYDCVVCAFKLSFPKITIRTLIKNS
jgi:hypothetical protein